MMLHQLVAPRWGGLVLGGAVLAALVSAAGREARACGATPVEVQALLPLNDATNVPLNAVLISSSNSSDAEFELHQVLEDSGGRAIGDPARNAGLDTASDAGAHGAVPLDVDCGARGGGGGAVCLARPLEPLKPNTRYAWQASAPAGFVSYDLQGLPREFTTGSVSDDEAISADSVGLVVTEDHRESNWDRIHCGISHWLHVAYSLRATEPAVLHFADYTPGYVMHATLLTGAPEAPEVAGTLYSPPDCLSPVVYDSAGHGTALPVWCPGEGSASPTDVEVESRGERLPPSGSGASPSPNAPPARSRGRALCALSMPLTSTPRALPAAVGLGVALLLAERRRRRL